MGKTEYVWLCLRNYLLIIIIIIIIIMSLISVEILFFVYGMKFGLLCFWEMMTHVVT